MDTRVERRNEGYTRLAIAITRQAAIDYKEEYERSKQLGRPTEEFLEVEAWFKSKDGKIITMGLGDIILNYIHKGYPITSIWDEDECDE